jgi:transposase
MEVAALLRGANLNNISELKRQGLSISRISEITTFDRKTIRKYLLETDTPIYGPRAPRPTMLDPFRPFIRERLAAGVWNGVVLHGELKEKGYKGGYTAVKDYLRPLRQEANRVAVRRYETPPGHQAQVDWGDLGDVTAADGTKKHISTFVLTLGSSRAMFADLTTDQKLPTLLGMHERAFHELGGVPQEILYDNMKTVVIKTLTLGTDERGEIRWNPAFLDFARYWGFTPRLCRPYRPQTKGKVEAGVKYIRRNFLCGREADSIEDLAAQLRAWLFEVANARRHGTTHRIVSEAWQEEKAHLQPIGARPPYPQAEEVTRKVSEDAFVAFRTNLYPAPWEAAGKEVYVRLVNEQVHILRDEQTLATHPLNTGRHQKIEGKALHAGMPFVPARSRGKTMIAITPSGPTVEQRSLEVYAEAAQWKPEGDRAERAA